MKPKSKTRDRKIWHTTSFLILKKDFKDFKEVCEIHNMTTSEVLRKLVTQYTKGGAK